MARTRHIVIGFFLWTALLRRLSICRAPENFEKRKSFEQLTNSSKHTYIRFPSHITQRLSAAVRLNLSFKCTRLLQTKIVQCAHTQCGRRRFSFPRSDLISK